MDSARRRPFLQPAVGASEDGIDRTDDGRPIFKTEHYDKLEKRGAIRILNISAGDPEQLQVHCELIPGTILDYKERMEFDPPLNFEPYDALSWCWGTQSADSWISIKKDGTQYAKAVHSDLVAALRALRHHVHDRSLWVDAICIDQSNHQERNHQVEMMADIYGKANCVRVWLGNPTESSNLAIRFIKSEVLQLQHFDELCESKKASAKWKSLLELMQRPWFSRRWVVQEVALARKAILHCGSAKISWNKFAVAVELFVEVETATHRLSEVMKKDPKFYHVPMWFEYVSALGASLLVDATGKLFRDYEYNQRETEDEQKPALRSVPLPDVEDDDGYESEDEELLSPQERAEQYKREDGLNRLASKGQPLLSLEYLVSGLSVFDTSKPHDTIYALLAIAKDTTPTAANKQLRVTDHTQAALEMFTEKKQYVVNYQASYVDVCKEFIHFCIERSMRLDSSRALDVICRPWAAEENSLLKASEDLCLPSWVPQLSKAAYGMDAKPGVDGMKMGRKNADPLVGPPSLTQRNYTAAETKGIDKTTFRFRKRVSAKSTIIESADEEVASQAVPTVILGDGELPDGSPEQDEDRQVASSQDGHSVESNEGIEIKGNIGKRSPKKGAQTHLPKPELKHFSLYLKGFVLDTIDKVQPSSQNGSIPSEWADFAGWKRMQGNPPDHFWRTLVADRGRDGKNPPVYYSRACKESFTKGSFQSGTVDTTGLINNERNSVVAQFCRRVQAAIWNRALVKTKSGKFGLVAKNVQAGDLVCILYGCSVPVVLRRHGPKDKRTMDFEMEWEIKYLADRVGAGYRHHLERTRLFRAKREKDKQSYLQWEQEKREKWKADTDWAEWWKRVEADMALIHEFNSWAMSEKSKKSKDEFDTMQDYINISLKAKCRPTPSDTQGKLWKEFEEDKPWREQWQGRERRFSRGDDFRVWARAGGKQLGYPGEWKASREEWERKKEEAGRSQTENSQFLCIDSFRAWLRDKGKFSGAEEEVKDKQDWEADSEWREDWRSTHSTASEDDEFNAWMRKSGRKNAIPQETKTKEEWIEFDDWIKTWRLENKSATPADLSEEWKREQDLQAEQKLTIDKQKSEAAKKHERLPFLERWRKGWKPPTVNWTEFQTALTYGRRWKQLVVRSKKDFLTAQGDRWSSPELRESRQRGRVALWETMKHRQLEADQEQEARSKDTLSTPSSDDDEPQEDAGVHIAAPNGDVQPQAAPNNDVQPQAAPNGNVQPQPPRVPERSGTITSPMPTDEPIPKARSATFQLEEGLPRSNTSIALATIQEELTRSNVESKTDLKERIQKKREELHGSWVKSQKALDAKLELWRRETPRIVGPGGQKQYDCGRRGREDGRRKIRRRLTDADKGIYHKRVIANLQASLGDDGRWWYQMLGECYVHSMMDGEAMAHQNNEGTPNTVFEIR